MGVLLVRRRRGVPVMSEGCFDCYFGVGFHYLMHNYHGPWVFIDCSIDTLLDRIHGIEWGGFHAIAYSVVLCNE